MPDAPSTTPVVRVFVSSTFLDMRAERERLAKHVFPRLRQFCSERGLVFVDVDLRWGIPDEEKAEGRVLPICLGEIEKCRPWFVGLLGDRYGWVPQELPPALIEAIPWLARYPGRSITELEFLSGALLSETANSHAFLYLKRTPEVIDGGDAPMHAGPLEQLKARVRSCGAHVREGYTDAAELGELVWSDLRAAIEREFGDRTLPDPREQERAEQRAFGERRTQGYVPRPRLSSFIDEHLAGAQHPLLVTGPAGIGNRPCFRAGSPGVERRWGRGRRRRRGPDH